MSARRWVFGLLRRLVLHVDPVMLRDPRSGALTALPHVDARWRTLVQNIRAKACVPFLGAGACRPRLPTGHELAEELLKNDKREDYQ